MNNFAPIVLFVYNRPEHTKKTVAALKQNYLAKESNLFIYSDGYKDENSKIKVQKVRDYIKTINGFKKVEIFEKERNEGLAGSIIAGVTEVVNKYGKAIVMEDDLESSSYFLKFMNETLELYKDEEKVASVHGYVYPIKNHGLPDTFFVKHASSWGWGTWKRAWDLFEPDGKKLMRILKERNLINDFNINGSYNFVGMLQRQIDRLTSSWAIRWSASCLVNDKLNLYPRESLIQNIGQDGSGTHRGNSKKHEIILSDSKIEVRSIPLIVDVKNTRAFEEFFRSLKPSLVQKMKVRLQRITGLFK